MNENKPKTDRQCANEALIAFGKTTTGKWALSSMFAAVSVLAYFGFVPERDVEVANRAAQTHYVQMLTDFGQQFLMIQDIHRAENLPERLRGDLWRLEVTAISNQAFGIAFIEAAAEMLSPQQFEQIRRRAVQDLDVLKQELHEMAEPLRQIEEEHDAH